MILFATILSVKDTGISWISFPYVLGKALYMHSFNQSTNIYEHVYVVNL